MENLGTLIHGRTGPDCRGYLAGPDHPHRRLQLPDQGQGEEHRQRHRNCGSICNQEVDFFLDGSKLPGDGNYDNLAAGSSVIVQSRSYTAPAAGTHNFRGLGGCRRRYLRVQRSQQRPFRESNCCSGPQAGPDCRGYLAGPDHPHRGLQLPDQGQGEEHRQRRRQLRLHLQPGGRFFLDGSKLPGDGNYDNLAAGSSVIVQSRSYTAPRPAPTTSGPWRMQTAISPSPTIATTTVPRI